MEFSVADFRALGVVALTQLHQIQQKKIRKKIDVLNLSCYEGGLIA
ncbi:hypothetical protein FHS57_002800 [Runella defluvii]|uniref:Uncharacterized protein n=1 Tax=Runella defluvii TaxID=370973 RepID=A0A7W5ZKZ9_9BACT|nr:hypothetical protein [Runella defluvii]MBB3838794.1 hypothetical protein [Runella defluvii]